MVTKDYSTGWEDGYVKIRILEAKTDTTEFSGRVKITGCSFDYSIKLPCSAIEISNSGAKYGSIVDRSSMEMKFNGRRMDLDQNEKGLFMAFGMVAIVDMFSNPEMKDQIASNATALNKGRIVKVQIGYEGIIYGELVSGNMQTIQGFLRRVGKDQLEMEKFRTIN